MVDPFDFGLKFDTLQKLSDSMLISWCCSLSAWMRTETMTTM